MSKYLAVNKSGYLCTVFLQYLFTDCFSEQLRWYSTEGSIRVGSGWVGSGRVGSGRVGSGRVGSGRVGSVWSSVIMLLHTRKCKAP